MFRGNRFARKVGCPHEAFKIGLFPLEELKKNLISNHFLDKTRCRYVFGNGKSCLFRMLFSLSENISPFRTSVYGVRVSAS